MDPVVQRCMHGSCNTLMLHIVFECSLCLSFDLFTLCRIEEAFYKKALLYYTNQVHTVKAHRVRPEPARLTLSMDVLSSYSPGFHRDQSILLTTSKDTI